MTDPNYNTSLLRLLVFFAFLTSVYLLFTKLITNKYKPSLSEYFFISVFALLIIYYRFNFNGLNWNLHDVFKSNIITCKYLDLILLLVFFHFNFTAIILIRNSRKEELPFINFLVNDDPITNKEQDQLNYSPTVDKLSEILLNEKHPKSISIGLIGPWGNGKSSVIQLVKNKIDSSDKLLNNDIIAIHFLPYLNHNEKDIINEFFTILSNALSPFNGRLSNHLVDYSQKLTDLYNNKSIQGFLENSITNYSKSSACELYENINCMLEETGKKIIVFIDDLDRLNQKEILQTLKLIRNTANFTNTFFVVAMDKQYVIRRLSEKSNILDRKFVDKFFQLEVYLPEIENKTIKKYFIKELEIPFNPSPADFKERLQAAMNDSELLFEDYVKNFRDAKRAINQIKFDLARFQEDFAYLNLKDFINFIFFKLKFPGVIKQLNDNRWDFLTMDTSKGIYNLIKSNAEDNQKTKDIFDLLSEESINSPLYLKKYQLFQELLDGKTRDKIKEPKITTSEKILVIKTLAHLFGEENSALSPDSIKKSNNFDMLMQQRIFTHFFKQSEFEQLFTVEKNALKIEITRIKDEEKTDQLLNRLEHYKTDDPEKMKRIIEYLIIIYETNNDNAYSLDVYKLIEKFTSDLYDSIAKPEITPYLTWLDQAIFSNSGYSQKTRLMLLSNIWKIRDYNNVWYLQESYIVKKTVELYKEYLKKYDNTLWDVNDYKTYLVYHTVKEIDPAINAALVDFWRHNNIELLCAQITEPDSFSNTAFKVSDTAAQIFGSFGEFIVFVESHPDRSKASIIEFLELFNLLQCINFAYALEFDFQNSALMLQKIEHWKQVQGRKDYNKEKRYPQVIIKITDIELGYKFNSIDSYREKYLLKSTIFNDVFYFTINVHSRKIDSLLSDFIKDVLNTYYGHNKWQFDGKIITEKTKINLNKDNFIEFISIKPKPKSEIKYLK